MKQPKPKPEPKSLPFGAIGDRLTLTALTLRAPEAAARIAKLTGAVNGDGSGFALHAELADGTEIHVEGCAVETILDELAQKIMAVPFLGFVFTEKDADRTARCGTAAGADFEIEGIVIETVEAAATGYEPSEDARKTARMAMMLMAKVAPDLFKALDTIEIGEGGDDPAPMMMFLKFDDDRPTLVVGGKTGKDLMNGLTMLLAMAAA